MVLLLGFGSAQPQHGASAANDAVRTVAHVTFGSCNRQDDDQSYWMKVISTSISADLEGGGSRTATADETSAVNSQPPRTDLFLWGGNAVYADIDDSGAELSHPRTPESIQLEYDVLVRNPHYQRFVKQVAKRVDGVWDDHDLGLRHADRTYPQTAAIKEIFLDFLNASAALRHEVSKATGLHHLTTVPAETGSALGQRYANSICAIMLDVRSERDPFPHFSEVLLDPMAANGYDVKTTKAVDTSDLLGATQWAWLEDVLQHYVSTTARVSPDDARAPCALTLLVSPWQVLLNDNKPFAGWDLYPASRTRLLHLLQKTQAGRFLFVSGHAELAEFGELTRTSPRDVHTDAVLKTPSRQNKMDALTRHAATFVPERSSLMEITSSGLTHSLQDGSVLTRRSFDWSLITSGASKDTSWGHPRYMHLTRTMHKGRSFGTIQLLEMSDGSLEVRLTLRDTVDGRTLTVVQKPLDSMPTYAATDVAEAAHYEDRPPFSVYNIPGDYPYVKRILLAMQCAEVPCVHGKFYIFYSVLFWLMVSAAVMAVMLVVAYGVLRELERRRRLKEEKGKVD